MSEQTEQRTRGIDMNAIPYDGPEEEWDSYEDEQEVALPGRPRRQGLDLVERGAVRGASSARSASTSACASRRTSSPTRARPAGLRRLSPAQTPVLVRLAPRTGASTRAGATGSGATGVGCDRVHARRRRRRQRLPGPVRRRGRWKRLGRDGLAASAADSLYITETSGNTVKVTLSSATKVTKNVGVGKNAVRPGDLVTVAGAKGSNGTISATTVNDTGASPVRL